MAPSPSPPLQQQQQKQQQTRADKKFYPDPYRDGKDREREREERSAAVGRIIDWRRIWSRQIGAQHIRYPLVMSK